MLFRLSDVTKTYGPITALRHLSVEAAPGRGRPARPERGGEDHAHPHAARSHQHRLRPRRSARHGHPLAPARHPAGRRLRARGRMPVPGRGRRRIRRPTPANCAAWPPADAMQRAHEVLNYVGLDEARYRPVESYSTGMKQTTQAGGGHRPRSAATDPRRADQRHGPGRSAGNDRTRPRPGPQQRA